MADESLFKRLSRLFSTNVIIRRVDGKLQTTDTERIQSYSDLATNFMKSRGLAYFHSTAARYGYDIMANISAQRVTIFRDYELMEQDPLIASALDIYADECSVKDEFGNVLAINSDNEKVKDALQNLFYDIMNIKFNIWPWIRNMPVKWDTYIPLLSGENITIKELSEKLKNGDEAWVYSIQDNTNSIVPGKVVWCDKNYTSEIIIKIILDDDSFIETSPEHPFILRDGTEKRADELKLNDSLMPLYKKLSSFDDDDELNSYELIYNPSSNDYEYTHRLVAKSAGIEKNKEKRILHHLDFNKYNNCPSNLIPMDFIKHKLLHAEQCKRILHTPEVTKKRLDAIDKYLRSDERKERLSNEMSGIYPEYFKEYNTSELHTAHNENRSIAAKAMWSNPEKRAKIKEKMKGSHTNHKVKSVEILHETSDVYCMTVVGPNNEQDRHNFAVCGKSSDGSIIEKSGVFVKNCKYGDHFLKLEIAENYGIINVIPISAYEVQREEGFDPDNPYRVRFVLQQVAAENRNLESYELAHFRMLSDTNFLPYGKSVIEPARRVWKQIMLMEDAMLIHRIMRAPEKRIFRVDVGNVAPNEVETFMKNMINKIKKTPYVDPRTGEYNLKFNMMNMTEDFFIPVRGGDSGTSIDTLAGLEYNAIDDINYLLNKLLAALKVPKAFLGYEEGIGGKATLAAEDVRFARTIERIQRIFLSELYKVAVVHLYVQGFKDEEITNFTLELTNPSTILEQERVSLWQEKVSLTRDMLETKMFDKEWIYKNVWKLTDADIRERGEKVLKDIKTVFRLAQIENEGNDPFITNQTFGTPHDLSVLQQRAKEGTGVEPKKLDFNTGESNIELNYNEHDNEDRTDQEDGYGEQNHIDGRDPVGGHGATSAPKHDMDINHKYKGSPLSMESIDNKNKELFKTRYGLNLLDQKYNTKSKEVISESLKSEDNEKKNNDAEDSGSFLDEKNLLDM